MDARVTALLKDLKRAKGVDPIETRHRIAELFGQVRDEGDHVALLGAFDAVMTQAVRTLEAGGKDTAALKSAILADRRGFAIEEAMAGGETIDPPALHRIVEREVAAGRMEADSFGQLVQAGAAVLGSTAPVPVRKNFLRKLLETGN